MEPLIRPVLVRGRCKCGRRYCIRNARAGVTVACPNCGRPIPITGADLLTADADARLIPVQGEAVEPLEVIPIDHGRLNLAAAGSQPGFTGKTALNHEEAMLASAQRGALGFNLSYDDMHPGAETDGAAVLIELEPIRREFVHDLFASFLCAGIPRNALNLLVTALAFWIIVAAQHVLAPFGLLILLVAPLYLVVIVYAMQFYWSVLRLTAAGEDEIPWAQSDTSFWDDGVKPILWMMAIAAFCTAPAWLYAWLFGRAGGVDPVIEYVLLGVGWFFWPVAVMSVALGNSIAFVRPDWLIRCVVGIGPVYLVAWLAVLIAVGGWVATWRLTEWLIWIPVAGMIINLYFGYIVFRTLGLLFRHFRERFPWKF